MRKLIVSIVALTFAGCAHHSETIKTTTYSETQARPAGPSDSLAEAEALREWVEHLRRRNYTYNVAAFQAGTDDKVRSPSGSKLPLRVEIKVYRADQKLHEFTFIPKENENIAIIAKDM